MLGLTQKFSFFMPALRRKHQDNTVPFAKAQKDMQQRRKDQVANLRRMKRELSHAFAPDDDDAAVAVPIVETLNSSDDDADIIPLETPVEASPSHHPNSNSHAHSHSTPMLSRLLSFVRLSPRGGRRQRRSQLASHQASHVSYLRSVLSKTRRTQKVYADE